jgi:VWFA-related protein
MLRVALPFLLLPPVLWAQEPAQVPVFPSAVELITVDAVVLDESGLPVRGLAREDFALREDGKPQDIASFEAFDLGGAPEGEETRRPSPVATNRPARTGARAFVVLVDDLGLTPQNLPHLATALARFLETGFRDGDEVTLATTSGDVWWSVRLPDGREDLGALLGKIKGRRLSESASDFLSDWEAYRINNYEGFGEGPVGTSAPGAAALPTVSVPGADLTGRVVTRWTETRVCAPENPAMCAAMVRMRAMERDSIRRSRTRAVMSGVERAVFSLTGVRGRKELLFLSEGFLHDTELPAVKQVAGICREANVVVNFLDVRGLIASIEEGTAAFAGGPPDTAEWGLIQMERVQFEIEGSVDLAEDTGGLAITSTNDLVAGARRVVDQSRTYYLLGYYPPQGKGARDWRRVKVEVRRPGLRVRARKGYTLRPAGVSEPLIAQASTKERKKGKEKGRKEAVGPSADPTVGGALLNAHDAEGVPLRAMAYVFDTLSDGKTRVLVAVEVGAQGLAFEAHGGKRTARLSLSIAAAARDTGTALRSEDKLELTLEAPQFPGWRAFTREFELPTGVVQTRVVARDESSGRLGAVTIRFEVPRQDELRLSTPILTDEVQPAPNQGGRPQPVILARRVFRATGILYCQVQVYGAVMDTQTSAPRVEASYVLRRASGIEVRRGAPSLITAAPGAPVVRLLGVPLEGMASGEYELVLRVEDKTSGRVVEREEPFQLDESRDD